VTKTYVTEIADLFSTMF